MEALTTHGYSRSRRSCPTDFLLPRERSWSLGAHCVDRPSVRDEHDDTLRSRAHCALAVPCIAVARPRRYAAVDANSWER